MNINKVTMTTSRQGNNKQQQHGEMNNKAMMCNKKRKEKQTNEQEIKDEWVTKQKKKTQITSVRGQANAWTFYTTRSLSSPNNAMCCCLKF